MTRPADSRATPRIDVLDDLVDTAGLADLRAIVGDRPDGASLSLADGAALARLDATLRGTLSVSAEAPSRFTVDRIPPGRSRHLEALPEAGARAVVFLTPCEGGALRFPATTPPLQIAPQPGRAVVWRTTDDTGRPDAATRHAVQPVRKGERLALAWSAGQRGRPALEPTPAVAGAAAGRTFVCVVDPETPDTTRRFLREACTARDIAYEERTGAAVAPWESPLPEGTLLYRPGVSWAAQQAEALLYQPGVATFWRRPEGPFLVPTESELAFARAGLPVPRTAWLRTRDREALRAILDWLGGPPAVLRVPGGEGGVGVMRVDSLASLLGLVDLLGERGVTMRLSTFVPDAEHWRLVVVGERVVTAYRNPVRPHDFRSEPSESPADYGLEPSPELEDVAVRASHVVGSALAGVDVLRHPSGRFYLLEANFPCYFGQATEAAGVDVAGPMIDYLAGKADSLANGEG